MTLFVVMLVDITLDAVGDAAWDNGNAAALTDIIAKRFLIIAHIGQNLFAAQIKGSQKFLRIDDVVARTGGKHEKQRISKSVNDRVHFRRQSADPAPLAFAPFLPLPC